jgi:hypothetical protein
VLAKIEISKQRLVENEPGEDARIWPIGPDPAAD